VVNAQSAIVSGMNHYTIEGSGDPVVLLHGGLSDSTAWGMQTPALAGTYRTFAFDRRGHGGTPDEDRPFDYDEMAGETIAFLEEVVGGQAHLVGWSDGGITALLTSMKRPDLVRRQVLIGVNFHFNGLHENFQMDPDPDSEGVAPLKGLYEAASIDPSHWPEFYAKANQLFASAPTLTVDDLKGVSVPTLVLAGDDDCIVHTHTVELYEHIPGAQLAIVPGTSHALALEKPALVNQLILEFLAEASPPGTFLPMRRVHT
jgi:pimeloyl-ACP methyl ester carboxylesterase